VISELGHQSFGFNWVVDLVQGNQQPAYCLNCMCSQLDMCKAKVEQSWSRYAVLLLVGELPDLAEVPMQRDGSLIHKARVSDSRRVDESAREYSGNSFDTCDIWPLHTAKIYFSIGRLSFT
jgi:hypothetical protein